MDQDKLALARAEFIAEVKAVNKYMTDTQALELWNNRDAAVALLKFRRGERIIMKKSSPGNRLQR